MKKCIYLTNNSAAIRESIKSAGIRVCICSHFDEFSWLHYNHTTNSVHAVIGCDDEDVPEDTRHRIFLKEAEEYGNSLIKCDNVEEFIEEIKKY